MELRIKPCSISRRVWWSSALLAVLAFASTLGAQTYQFSNTTDIGSVWTHSPGGASSLWAVDANPTTMPYSGGSITPYRSAPYCANYNDGVDCYNGVQNSGGIMSPAVDLTFAPSPKLDYWQLQHRYYYYNNNYYHIMEVRVWDTTRTTLHYKEVVGSTSGVLTNWHNKIINLNNDWGNVKVEFYFYSNYWYSYYDQYTGGWFVDDVSFTGLTPPTLAIMNQPTLGSIPVGSPANIALTAQNGTPPYQNWRVVSGALPPGLTIGSGTGIISGTPTDSGNYSFKIGVNDNIGGYDDKTFYLAVTRQAGFVYPVKTIPYTEDYSTDSGWVFSTNDPSGGDAASPGPYSDLSQGGWERAGAQQSAQGSWYSDQRDPAVDHSATADNMIMGVGVGEQWNQVGATINNWYWAYSPQITVTGYRTLDVKFWRWINAYYYYVPSRVDMWNPMTSAWVQVWTLSTYGQDYDSSWRQEIASVDFGSTPGAGAKTRFRCGWRFTTTSTSYNSGGFNIDDIQVIEKPQPGILEITKLEVYSTQQAGSTPKVFVGQTHPVIMEVRNTSSSNINVHTFTYSIHLGGTPQNVGTLVFGSPGQPSAGSPWVIPPGTHYISNTSGTQICHIDFNCTALPPTGSGTSVILNVQLLGKEQGGLLRATISDSQTDPSGDEVMTIFTVPPLQIIDPTVLPDASLSVPYTYTFTAQFGTPPYVNWQMTTGPAWLTFDAVNHRVTGTPTAVGAYNLTIRVNDSATPTAATATKNFTVNVVATALPLQITTSAQLPNATETIAYNPVTLNAAGGVPPYAWSALLGGALPTGMTYTAATATVSGTPSAGTVGSFSFTVRVTDSATPTAGQVTRTFYLNVLPANPSVGITTPATGAGSPPDGQETAAYNGGTPFQFTATGGYVESPNKYNWTVTSGSFPPGLILHPTLGQVSGTPTTSGTYTFTLRASDGAFPPNFGETQFTIDVDPLVPFPLSITTSANLAQGAEGNFYTTSLTANYGQTPYTWAVKAGSTLPNGLTLDAQTGTLAGIIATGQAANPNQDFTFTITVTDSTTPTAATTEKTFTLNIVAFVAGPITVTTADPLPQAGVQNPYSIYLRATGGAPADPQNPYQWAVANGSTLPTGLSLSIGGLLDGVPNISTAGTHTFTVDVNDGAGSSTTKTFNLQINGYPVPPGTGTGTELDAGKRRTELRPFWEGCSAAGAAGGMGMSALGLLACVAALRRRRKQ
ncbi:MAG: putative Ig domain-containing protein [Planctomycetes bacterium]|nr:putative Ig domain-containing protein [Planctomycetota bacterium]